MKRRSVQLLLAFAVLCAFCQPKLAQAEVTVIFVGDTSRLSNTPPPPPPADSALRYQTGQRLPNNPLLNIPECIHLILYNGTKFVDLWGPYRGRLNSYIDKGRHECFIPMGQPLGVRTTFYDTFFREICQVQKLCDAPCSAAYKMMSDKSGLTLKCP
jgi:hypothetical protein